MKNLIHLKSILLLIGCFYFCKPLSAQNADIDLLNRINPQNPGSGLWRGVSSSIYPVSFGLPVGLLAAGLIKKDKALQYKGWEAAGSLVINAVITQGIKYAVNRQRPFEKYDFIYPYKLDASPSFPSFHTSAAFATATTLTLECKKWYVAVPAYAWAAGVGYSRMYLGEHYPSDVIAGAVVGAGSAWLSHWATQKLFHKK